MNLQSKYIIHDNRRLYSLYYKFIYLIDGTNMNACYDEGDTSGIERSSLSRVIYDFPVPPSLGAKVLCDSLDLTVTVLQRNHVYIKSIQNTNFTPPRNCGVGYIFTSVCLSVRACVCVSVCL